MRALWLSCLAVAACGNGDDADTSSGGEDVDDDGADYTCEVVELDPVGPSPPHVGDAWTVWLKCDGALLQGPSVLRFDPTDFAKLDGNVATFQYAGTGLMSMSVGGERAETEVEVLEAE